MCAYTLYAFPDRQNSQLIGFIAQEKSRFYFTSHAENVDAFPVICLDGVAVLHPAE